MTSYLPIKNPPWRSEVNPLGPPAVPTGLATPVSATSLADLESRVEAGLGSVATVASGSAGYNALSVGTVPTRAYLLTSTDRTLAITETAGAWTLTLLLASSYAAGFRIRIQDESGGAQANNITVLCQGSDLINGNAAYVIALNYGSLDLSVNASQNGYYTSPAGASAAQGPVVIPPPPVITGV